MGRDSGKTDRFRQVFEPEDIFDRFVQNANKSTEAKLPDDDDVTGCIAREALRRGGPPDWDHRITVVGPRDPEADIPAEADPGSIEIGLPPDSDDTMIAPRPERVEASPDGTRPDAPMPLAMERAFDDADSEADVSLAATPSPTTDSGQRILLLTKVKETRPLEPVTPEVPQAIPEEAVDSSTWKSVVAPRGEHTQRVEASRVVPDVVEAASRKHDDGPPSGETGEDGQMPTRELDQILSDMTVLLRYGHAAQVRDRLDQLRRAYPEDLLLLRRIAEFHVEHAQKPAALDALFGLARGLFERRNVEGMRQALEQVLLLDPDNPRAYRLLGLLDKRPDGTDD